MCLQRTRSICFSVLTACAGLALSASPLGAAAGGAGSAMPPTPEGIVLVHAATHASPPPPVSPAVTDAPATAIPSTAAQDPEEGGDLPVPTVSWDEIKARLANRGLEVEAGYVSDVSRVPGTAQVIARGLSTVSADVDLGRVLPRLHGTRAFVSHLWKGGSDGTARIPLTQAFSNIDNFNFQKLYEAFIETTFERVPLRVKVGQVDANSEFAAVDGGLDFVNSSMGFSPSIFLLPTYPNPTPSANVFVDPVRHVHVGVGVYAQAEGPHRWTHPFVIGQVAGDWTAGDGYDGYVRVGGWRQGVEDEFGVATPHGGAFVVAEQTVWQSAPGQEGTRSLKVFGQVGVTNSVLTPVSRHIGAGASWTGLLKGRAADVFGVGATAARMGLASDFPGVTELAFGPYYRLSVAERFQVGPDVQFVLHPGGDPTASTMTVLTVRVTAAF